MKYNVGAISERQKFHQLNRPIANLDIILDLIYDHATKIEIYFSIEIFKKY